MTRLLVFTGCQLRPRAVRGPACAAVVLALVAAACAKHTSPSTAGPQTFTSPDAAAQAIYDAAKGNDTDAVLRIFGPTAKEFLVTGDPTADREAFKEFTDDYEHMHRFGKLQGGDRVLIVGVENYPFPFPLRASADGRWQFDPEGGRQEFLARRIGENELTVMGVLDVLASAQVEYYSSPPAGSAPPQYAQRFTSSPGKKDGLYWPAAQGEPESPIGSQLAQAANDEPGGSSARSEAFHGYFFRMLTEQGPHAAGGARNYIVDGHMIGGFAFLAYPAEYRKTAVMSFMINQDGELFQRDLGADTTRAAESLVAFDPSPGWSPVR